MSAPATDRPYRQSCGDYGGRRRDGSRCRLPPGHGREDADRGRCAHHVDDPGTAPGMVVGSIGDGHGPTPPPEHLSEKAAAIWTEVVTSYVVEIEGLPVLEQALAQYDRAMSARAEIEEQGLSWTHPETGAVHANPAVQVERNATKEFRLAWKALDLDIDAEVV